MQRRRIRFSSSINLTLLIVGLTRRIFVWCKLYKLYKLCKLYKLYKLPFTLRGRRDKSGLPLLPIGNNPAFYHIAQANPQSRKLQPFLVNQHRLINILREADLFNHPVADALSP